MPTENGLGSVSAMDSSFQGSSSLGYTTSSSVDGKIKSLNPSCNGNGNNGRLGFQSPEALVEDGIKYACQQLTMKLSDIHMASRRAAEAATRRSDVAAWLNSIFGPSSLPTEPTEEDLRAFLRNGIILCTVMNKLNPGSIPKIVSNPGPVSPEGAAHSAYQHFENVRNFLVAVDDLRLPTFEASDLEQGSMVNVVDCLLSLKEYFDWKHGLEVHSLWKQGADIGISNENKSAARGTSPGKPLNSTLKSGSQPRKRWILPDLDNCATSELLGDQSPGLYGQKMGKSPLRPADCKTNIGSDTTFDLESLLSSPVMSDSTSAWIQHIGQKFREVLQVKARRYPDLHAVENSGMLNCLDNAPSQSLLSLVSAILGDKQNEEVPSLVEFTFKKVMEEFERRLLTQGEQMKKLKHALREVLSREDKIMARANVLEALAAGAGEEIKLVKDQLQKIKMEKMQVEDEKKAKEQDVIQLTKEKEESEVAVRTLKDELDMIKKMDQEHVQQLEMQKREVESELQEKLREMEDLLAHSKRKTEELEALSALEMQNLKLKDSGYQKFLSCQLQALQDVKKVSQEAKAEVINVQKYWQVEMESLEEQLKGLANAATGYHKVLAENRQLYNEVQDLKGNIRVYCRVRPFLSGQTGKQTTIDYIGENGDLLIVNPSKQGKEAHRMFNFNKVFGPSASQEEVFLDTRPLIRSVLDGYNVCIFAYGQTGSGKTFTMTGPNSSSEEDWGVNYRALNDLFQISQKRKDLFKYEVGVQMIEIYNEQVRDLLTSDGSHKRLGIRSISQPNGLSVPDASMLSVESTTDVLDLMKIGQRNRAVGATALNERSSRSHSVLTVHVQGTDFASGAILRGCLHLVDLAGSERVDRSEVTGDRLREAQHINKSLSALGDVISALAHKNAHVPYRNSKLTQILQDSLGGQAKTLMFVQLNPDIESYSETISSLKFAERVSGVELGAARSNKESKDIRDLKEQITALKDVVAKKDVEIERLQTLKESRIHAPDIYFNSEKLKMKATNPPVTNSKASAGGQVHRNRSLTTEGHESIEGRQTLTGQVVKRPLRTSAQENTSQEFESTSTGDSDDMLGKNSTPKTVRRGMTLAKRSVDPKITQSTSEVAHLKMKLRHESFIEEEAVSKGCQERVRSSSDSSLLGTASQDEVTTPRSANMEKMNVAVTLADNDRIVSDADNGSEYSDKHSDVGSQETSIQSSEILRYKDQCVSLNHEMGNVRSSYSSLESGQNIPPDIELLGLRDGDLDERLSEISDGDLSMGTETDGSMSSIVELTLFPEKRNSEKLIPNIDKRLMTPSRIPRPPFKTERKTLVQSHSRVIRHSSNAPGADHPSARRSNGLSTNPAVDSSQRRVSHRHSAVDSPQRPISHRQSASSQLAGSSTSSKRWQ
eukprot:Gb_07814 [translate_table: standard]